jgi:hypothetical protein
MELSNPSFKPDLHQPYPFLFNKVERGTGMLDLTESDLESQEARQTI